MHARGLREQDSLDSTADSREQSAAAALFFAILMGQQDAHVLDRRDQVILDLLPPEPPPARAFEVMIVGGIGKTALHQVLASFAVASRGGTVRLSVRYI